MTPTQSRPPQPKAMENMMDKHTPTPWRYVADKGLVGHWTVWADVKGVETFVVACDWHQKEDVTFIVKAVNSHEQLVAALTEAKAALGYAARGADVVTSDKLAVTIERIDAALEAAK